MPRRREISDGFLGFRDQTNEIANWFSFAAAQDEGKRILWGGGGEDGVLIWLRQPNRTNFPTHDANFPQTTHTQYKIQTEWDWRPERKDKEIALIIASVCSYNLVKDRVSSTPPQPFIFHWVGRIPMRRHTGIHWGAYQARFTQLLSAHSAPRSTLQEFILLCSSPFLFIWPFLLCCCCVFSLKDDRRWRFIKRLIKLALAMRTICPTGHVLHLQAISFANSPCFYCFFPLFTFLSLGYFRYFICSMFHRVFCCFLFVSYCCVWFYLLARHRRVCLWWMVMI